MRKILLVFILLALMLSLTGSAKAGDYYFELTEYTINAFWNADGSLSIDYLYVFDNSPSAGPIEYVDVSITGDFDENSISADVNGNPVSDISKSGYQGDGVGVAVGLGQYSIKPGKSGRVHVYIGRIERVLYEDTEKDNYASAVLGPAYFDSSIIYGTTDLTMIFHLPPGVQPEEPRWHEAPSGFPSEPEAGFDNKDQITYTWRNDRAVGHTLYNFGASFPMQYVPESSIVRKTIFTYIAEFIAAISVCLVPALCVGGIGGFIAFASYSDKKRRMQYLPPRISIEGHGIKRGLTAVEAAVLMEQPLDKILTMILFGVLKKGAAQVTKRDPLDLEITEPLPEGLQAYEQGFLAAFIEKKGVVQNIARRRELQDMMVALVRTLSEKMKGFSRRETIDYYKDIMQRAWAQVEAAGTPEVKSQKYDENMEWTMLDRDYDKRTRDVFHSGPVYVPVWWGRFDPTYRGVPKTSSTPSPASPGGAPSLPRVPGADFAASVVNGVQSFSSNVVGSISEFTRNITQKTNPVPVATTSSSSSSRRSGGSSSSGGHSCACACACACAGCACACAGGGR